MVYIWACKYFHTTCNLESNCTPRQLGNAMWKLFGGKVNTMPQKDNPTIIKSEIFSEGRAEGKSSANSRRSKVLNKIFMRYITEIMATGQHSSEIVGHRIEINRVKITPNYKVLNVFWVSKDNSNIDKIDNILAQKAGYLKSELSQLRIMGVVPDIHFVKDKEYANMIQLDKQLAKADFGEDHVPFDPLSKLKSELELHLPLDEEVKIRLQKLEDKAEALEDSLPPMTHNIFDLNHSDILRKIKKSVKKSEALHRQNSTGSEYAKWVNFKATQTVNENPISLGNERLQQEAFRKFLRQREIIKAKAGKKKNENIGLEYLKADNSQHYTDQLDKLTIENYVEEEDFIIDEIEQK